MKTFIVARTKAEGFAWCRDNGIQPYSRNTHIIYNELSTRGLTIGPEDTLEYLYVPSMEIVQAVNICLMSCGK